MCFTVSIFASTHEIETALGASFEDASDYQPYVHVSGFVHPLLPVVTAGHPNRLRMMRWGLIPAWVKDAEQARDLADKTLNARCETVFEKPSFRASIRSKRALVPVNGFVEWRHEGGIAYPYVVRDQHDALITLGGLWDSWTDQTTGEVVDTCSILTTSANELLRYVHNTKHRMPVIIPAKHRDAWLAATDRQEIEDMMQPYPDGQLEAIPVSREVSRVKVNMDHQEMIEAMGEPLR